MVFFSMNFCVSLYVSYFKPSRIIIQDDAMVVLSYRTIQINENTCKFTQRLWGALADVFIAASSVFIVHHMQ